MSTFLLMACSKQSDNSLDGEYYWINENRNEVAFVISGDTGIIKHGEAEVFTIDISGMKHDYYKKDSKVYQEALKKYGYQ